MENRIILYSYAGFGYSVVITQEFVDMKTVWGLGRTVHVPVSEIASVEAGNIFMPSIEIKTSGGETYVFPAWGMQKQKALRALETARSANR